MVEVDRRPETPIKVSSTITQMGPVPFSTPFSAEFINALHYRKVKMPTSLWG